MKRRVSLALLLIVCLVLSAVTVFAADSGEEAEQAAEVIEKDRCGCFGAENGEYILVQSDGTFALINIEKKSSVEGTITVEAADRYRFAAEGAAAMDAAASYGEKIWTVDGRAFKSVIFYSSFICESNGDGFEMEEDGTFTAYRDPKNKTGKAIGTYERSGWQWIFTSPGIPAGTVTGYFDGKDWIINGARYEWGMIPVGGFPGVHFWGVYANEDSVSVLGHSLKTIVEDSFHVDADLFRTTLRSGQTSGELTVTSKKGKKAAAKIIAINPYENEAPLADCVVCSFYTEDTSNVFSYDINGGHCGEDLFDKLLTRNVYYYTPSRLVYKVHVWTMHHRISFSIGEDPKGEKILEASGNCDLTFNFDGSKLKSFCFTCPDLLYSGLDDNVDPDTLADMDPAEVREAIDSRNSILEDLKDAFRETDLDLQVDERTGEVTMDNAILFAPDSYELSGEGKQYLDSFMKVYASVLLSENNIDKVESIRFEGHTDSRSTYGHNKILSEHRAASVLQYCLQSADNGLTAEEKGLLEKLAVTEGYANADPVYDENGKEDMDASRRVTVKFHVRIQ